MSKFFRYFIIFILFLFASQILESCYEEVLVLPEEIIDTKYLLKIDNKSVAVDFENNFALATIDSYGKDLRAEITIGNISDLEINDEKIENNNLYTFGNISSSSEWKLTFKTSDGKTHSSRLKFTDLPTVQIFHSIEIPEEYKIPATFILTANSDFANTLSYCGIEIRGGQASDRAKKAYGIEFWEDLECSGKRDETVLGMRCDDDWILDAMYIDKAKMRNRASFDLWQQILESCEISDIHNKGKINGKLVEVFINYLYQGVYFIQERLDAKQLELTTTSTNNKSCLYKSEDWTLATTFQGVTDTLGMYEFWCGWEQKHPKPEIQSTWFELYNFIHFASYSDNSKFSNEIFSKISKESIIDYFILMNITKATDNVGKNIFLAKPSANEPFYICPWDMDATWGRWWDGNKNDSQGILSFKLYERLLENNPGNFKEDLKSRWFSLREHIITSENISKIFLQYKTAYEVSGAFERECARWPESQENLSEETDYINQWTRGRIEVLDEFFEELD